MSLSFHKRSSMLARLGASAIALGWMLLLVSSEGCGSSSAGSDAGASGGSGSGAMCSSNAGGPVTSPNGADRHCIDSSGNQIKQVTSEKACKLQGDAAIPVSMDMSGDDAGATSDYGPTLYGDEADDDDCKYHVKWTASCIEENKNVTFTVKVTKKADGMPSTDASKGPIDLDVYLSDAHVSPSIPDSKEIAPGEFTAGPVVFDAPGKWTVRFHIRDKCVDLTDDSPHGHAAFYVNVP